MRSVGVVGAGTMGRGVSQMFAEAGIDVVCVDVSEQALRAARAEIDRNLRLAPLTRGFRPDHAAVAARIEFTSDYQALSQVGYVVENVTENWTVKAQVYPLLDAICGEECVLGVNTSAIPITRVAGLTGRADRVVGTHIMNPAPMMPTVEVIRGHLTSAESVTLTSSLFARTGRRSVVVNDMPGFVTNRVMMLTVNEAAFLIQDGVATPSDVDRLFRECFNHKMGPLATADLIGLDTVLFSLEVLYEDFKDPKYRPCPYLRRLVDAGLHGRKTGAGFFDYETI
ncbi:3-hydroxyacyl-CoA dehydrogenase family protein [Catenulispora sp. EB89]|uniref:3-hydroxyacyl-CoA dehydrogenase family protein n=1 Tax=Catenulispora sp. EB89 TaxID=3156257 RepID=UPI003512700E